MPDTLSIKHPDTHPQRSPLVSRVADLIRQRSAEEKTAEAARTALSKLRSVDPSQAEAERARAYLEGRDFESVGSVDAKVADLTRTVERATMVSDDLRRAIVMGNLRIDEMSRDPALIAWCVEPVSDVRRAAVREIADLLDQIAGRNKILADLSNQAKAVGLSESALPYAGMTVPTSADYLRAVNVS